MSPLSQTRLILPLLEAIRDLLGPGEHAAFKVTTHGSPYIEAVTLRGGVIVSINEDGLYMFDTAGGLYVCDPHDAKDVIYDTIRRALNDAREEQA